jgi:hypothetical protein
MKDFMVKAQEWATAHPTIVVTVVACVVSFFLGVWVANL